MTLAASTTAPAVAPFDGLAPLILPEDLRLTPEQFARVCAANPEAVLERDADGRLIVMTPTVSALRRKLAAYRANGARLGWLLLPRERAVEIWAAAGESSGSEPRRLDSAEELEGGPEFPGLRLELAEIWNP